MMNKIEIFNFIKKNWYFLITIILMGAIIVLILFDRMCENDTKRKIDEIEYIDSIKTYHKLFYEKKFSDLKKENKSLYDSLKKDKDRITYLLQFTSKKEYNTGKVATNKVINTNTAFKKDSVYTRQNQMIQCGINCKFLLLKNHHGIPLTLRQQINLQLLIKIMAMG